MLGEVVEPEKGNSHGDEQQIFGKRTLLVPQSQGKSEMALISRPCQASSTTPSSHFFFFFLQVALILETRPLSKLF